MRDAYVIDSARYEPPAARTGEGSKRSWARVALMALEIGQSITCARLDGLTARTEVRRIEAQSAREGVGRKYTSMTIDEGKIRIWRIG